MHDFCFWSIADGPYASILQTLVDSYHRAGMAQDFHAISDRKIQGAIHHPIPEFDRSFYLFKYQFLYSIMRELDYRYFVYLDADHYFVRKPRDIINLVSNSPVHAFLESDCTSSKVIRKNWGSCPLSDFIRLMRNKGIKNDKIYNLNGGFFIVARESIEEFCRLVLEFWHDAYRQGILISDEPALSYAIHQMRGDPEPHLLKNHFDLWATDWRGHFAGRIPDGNDWIFTDYMTGQPYNVNPAIVHAIHSKNALIKEESVGRLPIAGKPKNFTS